MPEKKVLFMDLDDTLLTKDKKVTPGNAAAVSAALDAGRKIVVCTGRPLCGASQLLKELHLDREGCYAICFNGAQVYDCFRQKTIFMQTLPLDQVRYIFSEADQWNIHAHTYDSHHLLCRKMDEETDYYFSTTKTPLRLVPELPDGLTEEPAKVILVDLHDHEKLEAFRAAHAEWAKGKITIVFSNAIYLEFVKEGISKGSAIRFLCGHLGIPMEETVGAGDSENDIPMLEACSVGCAVANASEACRSAADYVTENDCDHDAIAEIIRRYL
jgi:Cof subfamily protein (haloacid dehalogenase superfamily)